MVATKDHVADTLLARLLDYLTARRAFEVAVDEACRQGWPDQEIYRVTGVSSLKFEAMLDRRQGAETDEAPPLDGPVAA